MKIKNILGLVTAFSVFVTAVSGHTTTSHRESVYCTGPTDAYQKKVNGTVGEHGFFCQRDHERRTDGLNQRSDQSDHGPRNLDDQPRW